MTSVESWKSQKCSTCDEPFMRAKDLKAHKVESHGPDSETLISEYQETLQIIRRIFDDTTLMALIEAWDMKSSTWVAEAIREKLNSSTTKWVDKQ